MALDPTTMERERPAASTTRLNGRGSHERVRFPKFHRRSRVVKVVALVLLVALTWLAVSLGGALFNPALGSSFGSRFAEWARAHGGSSVINWVENEWYSHHAPPKGGTVPPNAIKVPTSTPSIAATTVPHLAKPVPIVPFASPVIPGEGQWSAAGRTVDGMPALYVTTLRPDAVHTSYVAGVAWMDTKLLSARLYSGSWIPGGGPYPFSAPVRSAQARTLVAAFNAGFLMSSANGGYYTNHQMVVPLRSGAASFVVYRNGTSNVVAWGPSMKINSNVVSVRQNLDLLVNNAKPVPGLQVNDTTKWGATLGNSVYVWRSGLGVTPDGALVYVAGPGLNITDLANLLVRAGAVRAMELDINTDWVNYTYYSPSPMGLAGASNGRELLSAMTGTPARYFASWWARDFITMSAKKP
ncbi:MAG TPA: phosphodiester glycosidase family protein [Acidimicrobiales bacterium]|nr:phosphodiester glycosidase family protein [Acidimicrobiales bacterium]